MATPTKSTSARSNSAKPKRIDPRGPRFSAAITSVVLIIALILTAVEPIWSLIPLFLQGIVFAIGAGLGPAAQPYGLIYRKLVQPRLGRPRELEDPRPPQFAQAVGLVFVIAALFFLALGPLLAAQIAIGFALLAALLNAVLNFCLGCELYLLIQRLRPSQAGR